MAAMLVSVADHGDPWAHVVGLSAHGGAGQTLAALLRRGWIESKRYPMPGYRLTQAGAHALGGCCHCSGRGTPPGRSSRCSRCEGTGWRCGRDNAQRLELPIPAAR